VSGTISLLEFQTEASQSISDRVVAYIDEPLRMGKAGAQHNIPFIQLLSSITASGKTLILADAVSDIAQRTVPKPVVLWLSKATVVVAQTYANLDDGGRYHGLLVDFEVQTLSDYDDDALRNSSSSMLYFATVGTFNQKQKASSGLNVFKSAIDEAASSTWDSLKLRPDPGGFRRPLLVVYDEAHNLSDQQTELLLELQPDAFILATATSKLPAKFDTEVISKLKIGGDYTDADLMTVVDASVVAESGLIKNELDLIGRQAPMEAVINDMHKAAKQAATDATAAGLPGRPKSVYVCKTNVSEATGDKDSPKQPFLQRQAPPILIWRYLVETLKVNPAEIAVYCDLTVDKSYPLPPEFVLFRGGDKDYETFTKGNFRHIIFNLSLQEGWDDPYVYFAYIDMSVGSLVRAEQVIGRLLRQPGQKHYPAQRLNTAQIFVRVDTVGVFDKVVAQVDERIRTGNVAIKIKITKTTGKEPTEYQPKGEYLVPITSVNTELAVDPIADRVDDINDYTGPSNANTKGNGRRTKVERIIGEPGSEALQWETYGESATVLVRWLFQREVELANKRALGLVLTSGTGGAPSKFDAKVGFGSKAAKHLTDVAKDVAHIYTEQVYLKLRKPNPYQVGPVLVDPDDCHKFKNAVHPFYDKLNSLETQFAKSIDETKLVWCRNPSASGYSIPLVEPGKTKNFYPDFLVWSDDDVFAIDTKGAHLHADAARKLVDIKPANDIPTRVWVRFISDGVVTKEGPQADSSGYTAWSFKPNGEPQFTHCDDMASAIKVCLKPGV
jgi:type III restriction enzyme